MKKNDGGPIYPTDRAAWNNNPSDITPGMSLRDAMAIAALPAIVRLGLANWGALNDSAIADGFIGRADDYIAKRAWVIADAMLAERDK